jgi:hypothetical protein
MASSITPQFRQYAQKIIQHELGHYVAGRVMGFRFDGMSIRILGPAKGHLGEAAIVLAQRGMPSVDAVRLYFRRRITVLYSGATAETSHPIGGSLKVDNSEALGIIRTPMMGAEQDWAKARELVQLLRSIDDPEGDITDKDATDAKLKAIDLERWNDAISLVEKPAGAIVSVAPTIVAKISAPGEKLELQPADLDELPEFKSIERQY